MSGAYAKIEAHEDLCAERYQNIRDDIGDLKEIMKTAGKALIGLVLALMTWGASQIYADLKTPPQAMAAVAVVTPAQGK